MVEVVDMCRKFVLYPKSVKHIQKELDTYTQPKR